MDTIAFSFMRKQRAFQFEVIVSVVVFVLIAHHFLGLRNNFVHIVLILFALALFVSNASYIDEQQTSDSNKVTGAELDSLQVSVHRYLDTIRRRVQLTGSQTVHIDVSLHKLDALYIDVDLIHFLHSISFLADFHDESYFRVVKGTNALLRIRRDLRAWYDARGSFPPNVYEMRENAIVITKDVMNHLHTAMYKMPKSKESYALHSKISNRLHVLLLRNVDIITSYAQLHAKQTPVTNATKIITPVDATHPMDPTTDAHFSVY